MFPFGWLLELDLFHSKVDTLLYSSVLKRCLMGPEDGSVDVLMTCYIPYVHVCVGVSHLLHESNGRGERWVENDEEYRWRGRDKRRECRTIITPLFREGEYILHTHTHTHTLTF